MTKISKAWYTPDDLTSLLPRETSKEQLAKDQEKDENMAKNDDPIRLVD